MSDGKTKISFHDAHVYAFREWELSEQYKRIEALKIENARLDSEILEMRRRIDMYILEAKTMLACHNVYLFGKVRNGGLS